MSDAASEELIHPQYNRIVKILLVDDSFLDLTVLSALLIDRHYTVRRTNSATAALRIAETVLPDLMLVDINMPEMNGYDLCRRLKASPKTAEIPVIFVSASGEGIDKRTAFSVGGADYIEKPFQPEEVDGRIQNQLKVRWAAQALHQKNTDLQTALAQLKQTQALVMEAERVATLSQIVSNLSAEICVPVESAGSSLQHMQSCCDNILSLLHLYEELCKRPEFLLSESQRSSQLRLIRSDVADMGQLLSLTLAEMAQMEAVAKSIGHLFSREEAALKAVDVNHIVERVLSILRRRFASSSQQPVQLDQKLGVIPRVFCYPNQLSQALFVMLSHALDAVHEQMQQGAPDYQPVLEVTTQHQHSAIALTIRHNGTHPPELTYLRTDPPQWTFWQQGSTLGTAADKQLSLFISYRAIVEKHRGRFDYRVAADGLTEFQVELPVVQSADMFS